MALVMRGGGGAPYGQYTAQCITDGYTVARLQWAELELRFEISCFLKGYLIRFLEI
jgi:hypothetical protein